jgi:hypothetical protein
MRVWQPVDLAEVESSLCDVVHIPAHTMGYEYHTRPSSGFEIWRPLWLLSQDCFLVRFPKLSLKPKL